MAYDATKFPRLGDLKSLGERIKSDFVGKEPGKGLSANDFSDIYKDKVDNLAASGGEPNVIESVRVNGAALPVNGKAIDIAIVDAYTKEEVDGKLSAVYKYKGTVQKYEDLPTAGMAVGDTYNIETADAARNIKAGDNVAWKGGDWDILSGVVDLSAYSTTAATAAALGGKVDKVTGKGLSENDFTDALKTKLDGIFAGATKVSASSINGNIQINEQEHTVYALPNTVLTSDAVATDAEVSDMLASVFG